MHPPERWQRRFDNAEDDMLEFGSCSYLQFMGSFILLLAWYGFNADATRCMGRACRYTAGGVAWSTTLSGCTATLGAYFFSCSFHSKLDVGSLRNGLLGGLVAITAAATWHPSPHSMESSMRCIVFTVLQAAQSWAWQEVCSACRLRTCGRRIFRKPRSHWKAMSDTLGRRCIHRRGGSGASTTPRTTC